MTVERKIVVGLEDIEAISLECNGCKCRVTMVPGKMIRIPEYCAQCRLRWHPENPAGHIPERGWPFAKFLESVEGIRALMNSEVLLGFRILLEFKEPKE